MIPSGKPHNQMILGPNDKEENKIKPVTFVRLCKNLKECDIDQISKIIIDMSKDKPFPDITSR